MGEYLKVVERGKRLPTLIAFSSVNTPAGRFKPHRIVEAAQANILFVNDRDNRWYQQGVPGVADDPAAAARELMRVGRSIGSGRVVTFGTSMGAYGAMLLAALGEADGCLAFGVEAELQLPGSRSAQYMRPADWPARQLLRPALEGSRVPMWVYASEHDEIDLIAALQLADLPAVTFTSIRGMEHPGVQIFDADQSIASVLTEFARAGVAPRGFERQGVLLRNRALIPALWEAFQAKAAGDKAAWLRLTTALADAWPREPLVQMRHGEALHANGQGAAADAWRAAIALCPFQYAAHEKLGAALRRKGSVLEAVEHLRRSIAINPWHAHGHHALGLALRDAGDLENAARHLQQAATINPGNAAFKESLAGLTK